MRAADAPAVAKRLDAGSFAASTYTNKDFMSHMTVVDDQLLPVVVGGPFPQNH